MKNQSPNGISLRMDQAKFFAKVTEMLYKNIVDGEQDPPCVIVAENHQAERDRSPGIRFLTDITGELTFAADEQLPDPEHLLLELLNDIVKNATTFRDRLQKQMGAGTKA